MDSHRYRVRVNFAHDDYRRGEAIAWYGDDLEDATAVRDRLVALGTKIVDDAEIHELGADGQWWGVG